MDVFKLISVENINNNTKYVIISEKTGAIARIHSKLVENALANNRVSILGLEYTNKGIQIEEGYSLSDMSNYSDTDSDIPGLSIIRANGDSKTFKYSENEYEYITGKELLNTLKISNASKMKPRFIVKDIVDYCLSDEAFRTLIISGIRRSGKTVAMLHTIIKLINTGISVDDIALIDMKLECEFSTIESIIRNCKAKYIFIDEASFIKNIVTDSRVISDHLCASKKIVLTGTDSLALSLSRVYGMYMRTYGISANDMSFKEYTYLFGSESKEKDVVSFLKYGGTTMSSQYSSDERIIDQIEIAILSNIKNTLKLNTVDKYKSIKDINDYTALYLIYGYIVSTACPKNEKDIHKIDVKITDKIKQIITECTDDKSDNKENKSGVRRGIRNALLEMGILRSVRNESFLNVQGVEANTDSELCCAIQALSYALMDYIYMKEIPSTVIGSLFETMIINECCISTKKRHELYKVSYCRFNYNNKTPEVDIVIRKEIGLGLYEYTLIEVKYSKRIDEKHIKNFKDNKILEMYGDNVKRIVVYNGETQDMKYNINGKKQVVNYTNAYDFMINIDNMLDTESYPIKTLI